MEYGAIDLHLRRSQFRIEREDGTWVQEGRFDTTPADLTRIFGRHGRLRLLIESSTESEWVAQHLETLGHEVIVADPSYLPMYGQRARRVKTDRRDTVALTAACRLGHYRRAHRVTAATRTLRQQLRVRRRLVQMRTGTINLVRAILRQEGLRLPGGTADRVLARLERVTMPPALAEVMRPVRTWIATLQEVLAALDAEVTTQATGHPIVPQLMTAPGVGPIIALSYCAILDTPARFGGKAARASAFLGLVPSEDSSAERRLRGHITKRGPRELRALLVQASWSIWRSRCRAGTALRTWAEALAARRGRRIAIVALARRLARILYAMWRDGTVFQEPTAPAAA
jgi:transposase